MNPRVRICDRRRWEVDFGDGRTAVLRHGWDLAAGDWIPDFYWDSFVAGERVGAGVRASLDEAFVSAWIAVAVPPPALPSDERLRITGLAASCERGDAPEVANVLRSILLARTGMRWSVRAGRGRERFHVRITAPARARDGQGRPRRLADGALRAADRVLLSSIFGCRVGRDGHLVEPHHGCRAEAVWLASGLEREGRSGQAQTT